MAGARDTGVINYGQVRACADSLIANIAISGGPHVKVEGTRWMCGSRACVALECAFGFGLRVRAALAESDSKIARGARLSYRGY